MPVRGRPAARLDRVSSAPSPRTIRYGDDPSQFGELSLPARRPRGVAVVIHGGFWRAVYGLEYGRPLAASLVEHGWAAWTIEYRRVGNGGGAPQTLDDVAAAIDALADLDLPRGRVITVGHSAGGHLATWSAARGRHDRWAAGVTVTGVVSQAGVVDLRSAYDEHLGDGAVEAFLGHPPGPDDDAVDPLQQLPLDVPVHCVHGVDDDVVPVSQSRTYVAAARARGAIATLTEVPGDHFVVIDPTGEAWTRTLEILDGL